MRPKVLFTDGEGPLVFKDLAADMTEKAIPGLFPILSFYDDYLTEIGTEGYQAGDTLALVVPHLLLHGVTDEDIAEEAKGTKVCLGVEDYIGGLKKDGWNVRVISTAYSQMWKLVGGYLDIPMQHIACTTLDLKELRKRFGSASFFNNVQEAENRILAQSLLADDAMQEVEKGKSVVEVLGEMSKFSPLRETLDGFYWQTLKETGYQALEVVQVMGGKRKIEAAQRFAQDISVHLSDVAYVGDSITDDAMHQRLSKEGGLPIAINGNHYAIRNARVAVATRDMRDLRPLLDAWQQGGFHEVTKFIENQSISFTRSKEGAPVPLEEKYALVNPSNQEEFQRILTIHKQSRRNVRGTATARLG